MIRTLRMRPAGSRRLLRWLTRLFITSIGTLPTPSTWMEYNKKQSSNRAYWIGGAIVSAILFLIWTSFARTEPALVTKAVVVLKGDSKVTGTVTFEQKNGVTTVTGDLKNLDPLASRGFHIHQFGDVSDGCSSTGSHFNPYAKNHGAPSATERHVGDLGNIQTDEFGSASFKFEDRLISLNGPLSIVGRAVVLHAGTDDLGKNPNDPESLKTGNAGARSACGVIGLMLDD
ncbi:Cu/Zn superoxide dismutase [Mycena epipterygia]|nr:Cu/Zn superoxide dismutase [Mycena epipterygia]